MSQVAASRFIASIFHSLKIYSRFCFHFFCFSSRVHFDRTMAYNCTSVLLVITLFMRRQHMHGMCRDYPANAAVVLCFPIAMCLGAYDTYDFIHFSEWETMDCVCARKQTIITRRDYKWECMVECVIEMWSGERCAALRCSEPYIHLRMWPETCRH